MLNDWYKRDGWVDCEERQPEKRGTYEVMRRHGPALEDGSPGFIEAKYRWNGSYWVTKGGSPSNAVLAWREEARF